MMGTDGNWVRTYNAASAKLFLAERELELAKLEDRRRRSHEFRGRACHKLRALFFSLRDQLV